MNNNNLENSIKNSVEAITPDVFDNIMQTKKTGEIVKINSRKKLYSLIAGIAAALLIISFGGGYYIKNNTVDSLVSIDVNPSIELKLNKNEKIIDATGLNDDANIILKGLKLKNLDLNTGVDQIVMSMLKNGYIDEMHNAVLVSINNDDSKKTDLIQAKINECIRDVLKGANVKPIIYNQKSKTNEHKNKSNANISQGKQSLIEKIVQADSSYTTEQLSALSMTEISKIIDKLDLDEEIECHRFDKDDYCEYCGRPETECKNQCEKTQNEKYCDDCGKLKGECVCIESSDTDSDTSDDDKDDEQDKDESSLPEESDDSSTTSEKEEFCEHCSKLESICNNSCKKQGDDDKEGKFCEDCGKKENTCKCDDNSESESDDESQN
ncbi:MAG: hypothetical protein RR036_01110 [Oscillospiraceae bacterium]